MQLNPLSEDEILFTSRCLLDHYQLLFPELDGKTINRHLNAGLKHIGKTLGMVADIRSSGMLPGTANIIYRSEYV